MTLLIAHRTDGFGARLLNMLVTFVLAERHGADFRFTWRPSNLEFHALDRAEKIFHQDFLAKYLVAEPSRKRTESRYVFIEPEDSLNDDVLRRQINGSTKDFVLSRYDAPEELLARFMTGAENPFAQAFRQIRFVEEIEAAIDAAEQVPLPPHPIAMHLRSGDIIFGHYRLDAGFESKVITLPLAHFLIEQSLARGETPIIFGQDECSCSKLAETMGIKTIEQMAHLSGMNATARAVFEMIILSRMRAIHGGLSTFVYVPAAIGAVPIIDPATTLPPVDIARIIASKLGYFEDDQEYPRLQIAFSYRSALHFGDSELSFAEKLDLVEGAVRNDPKNAFYKFTKAALLIDHHDMHRGDAALGAAFSEESDLPLPQRSAFQFLGRRNIDGSLKSAPFLKTISSRMEQGGPYGHFALAIASLRLSDYPAAIKHLRVSRRALPSEPQFKALAHILRRELLSPRSWLRYCKYHIFRRGR